MADSSELSYPSPPADNALIDLSSPGPKSDASYVTSPGISNAPPDGSFFGQHAALHSLHSTDSLRLKHLEQLCARLSREQKEQQEEFGKHRKKFMDKITEMERERNLLANTNERYGHEVRELSRLLLERDEEMRGITGAAAVAQKQAREDFDADRVRYEEEMASLRQVLQVQTQETAGAHQQERESWKRDRDNLIAEIQKLRSEAPPTKTTLTQDETLELDMAKAALDAQVLKSVVVPLENEIQELKRQLQDASNESPLIDLSSDNDAVSQLSSQLKLERRARQDLEMHTDALVQQKTITHQEILMLTQELEKCKDNYKSLQAQHSTLLTEHSGLKQTWELANQQFLVQQDNMKQEIASLKGQPSVDEPVVSTTPSLERRSSSLSALQQVGVVTGDLATLTQENERLRKELAAKIKTLAGYEKQLQRVQGQMLDDLDEKDRALVSLRAEADKLRAGVMRERDTQKQLRTSVLEQMEIIKSKISNFTDTERKLVTEVRKRKDNFTELKHDTQTEIARLSEERVELRVALDSAREEYDCLKSLQGQQMREYKENIGAEQMARKEAEMNLAGVMEQLEALQEQLDLARQNLAAETSHRESLTAEFTTQLNKTITENRGLHTLKADLELERRAKEKALTSKSSIQEKSTAFIQEQQRQIEKLHKDKESNEKQVTELTRQLSSLKHQLDRTSETQRDFVELSQSLQMKLVQMEENQKSEDTSEN